MRKGKSYGHCRCCIDIRTEHTFGNADGTLNVSELADLRVRACFKTLTTARRRLSVLTLSAVAPTETRYSTPTVRVDKQRKVDARTTRPWWTWAKLTIAVCWYRDDVGGLDVGVKVLWVFVKLCLSDEGHGCLRRGVRASIAQSSDALCARVGGGGSRSGGGGGEQYLSAWTHQATVAGCQCSHAPPHLYCVEC